MDPLSALKGVADYDGNLVVPAQAQAAVAAGQAGKISPSDLSTLDAPPSIQAPSAEQGAPSFANMLSGMVSDVSQKQTAADTAINGLLSGQNVPLHEAVIAMEEANVSFQLMLEVRNKLLDAYQELMKMQV